MFKRERFRERVAVKIIAFAMILRCSSAIPFDIKNYDDVEFVPLERKYDGFEAQPSIGPEQSVANPELFFHHAIPFFEHDLLHSFGDFQDQQPWYKGENVCVDKREFDNDEEGPAKHAAKSKPGNTENLEVRSPLFGQFHFSVNSCEEKPNKYVCTRMVNRNGQRKTLVITRKCCLGYSRPRNADFLTPCSKQDVKSLDEIGVEMGAAQFAEFAKSNGDLTSKRNITVFMPTDKAFERYKDEYTSDSEKTQLIRGHAFGGEISLYDVQNDELVQSQNEGVSVRINMYQKHPSEEDADAFRYTANCVPVQKHDIAAEEGFVHTIDGVLRPVTKNLMELIRERSDLSIMRTVLETTQLAATLEKENPVTVFLPNDGAFEKLDPHLRRILKEGKGCAANLLKNHIMDITFCSAASAEGRKTTAYNILGEPMLFNRTKVKAGEAESLFTVNKVARVTEADIMATNGVLHIVDTVLLTESATPLIQLLDRKNLTLFRRLIEAAGLETSFNAMDNVTVFAPTDKALQSTEWVQTLNTAPDQLRGDAKLAQFLNYHIGKAMIKTCDLEDDSTLETAAGSPIRINLYSTHALFSNVMNRATANCARLVRFDDETCGSVLHQVDRVLQDPQMNLLQLLQSNPNYSKFLELVRASNLTGILSQSNQSYTLLIPKNDVFDEIEDWEQTLVGDRSRLDDLVRTHIVNDVVCCAGIVPTNWPFVRSIVSLNGAHLRISRDRRPQIENAGVTKCDHIATNGIIHEINDVIIAAPKRPHNTRPQLEFDSIFQ